MVSRPEDKEIDIKVRFVPAPDDKSQQEVYANIVQVSHTPWDFTLVFCCATMPEESEVRKVKNKKEMAVHSPRVASIKVSPRMANEIVQVLQAQINQYKKEFESSGE